MTYIHGCNGISSSAGTKTFGYTGGAQMWTAPCTGTFKFEVWGAQGGLQSSGGMGAYASGNLKVAEGNAFYAYVGGNGYEHNGYNGAGKVKAGGEASRSGGGSTDIRISSTNLYSRIIVAAGGSGAANETWGNIGVPGGGLTGYNGIYSGYNCSGRGQPTINPGTGGTQISGGLAMACDGGACMHTTARAGSFYYGADDSYRSGLETSSDADYSNGTASSGWYGGGGSCTTNCNIVSPGSGSSYIAGHKGSIGTTSSTSHVYNASCKTNPTYDCSKSYTGFNFIENTTTMIDGAGYNWTTSKGSYVGQPKTSGSGTQAGQAGDGYVRITAV